MVLATHWVSCYFYNDIQFTYDNLSGEDRDGPWKNNYWLPPIDVGSRKTTYYSDLILIHQYVKIFYYSFVLVT